MIILYGLDVNRWLTAPAASNSALSYGIYPCHLKLLRSRVFFFKEWNRRCVLVACVLSTEQTDRSEGGAGAGGGE